MAVPAPIDVRQLLALGAVAWRELSWVLPSVSREVAHWRQAAQRIPDEQIRSDALSTLASERFSTEGAALFSAMPRERSVPLVRLLATYQILVDYIDTLSETPCDDVVGNGTLLYRALYDAVDLDAPTTDYYALHPWRDDGGYLQALVDACRERCAELPAYEVAKPQILAEAERLDVCALNHEPDDEARVELLREWARREFPSAGECTWFELTAAATSSVTIHALFAQAASPETVPRDVTATRDAYFPWGSLLSTMLDSYADAAGDHRTGAHSYVGYYPSEQAAADRLGQIVARSVNHARALPRGRRHVLIATGMVAMYLSTPQSRTDNVPAMSRHIRRSGGPLPALQLPVLRAWRMARARG